MTDSNQKIVQYLHEAHASEVGLVRVLQSQIAMTPRGSYRSGLEQHLRETREHARRVESRLRDLGDSNNPLQAGIGVAETVIAQALALGKTPFDLLRGSGGEEKVLKNAKDAAATEALEIATYTALERLANGVGDSTTAKLAASIRAEEERMLERILAEIPKLTDAVVGADVHGEGSYDIAKTGAADATRDAARTTKAAAKQTTRRAQGAAKQATKSTARQARKVPGGARAQGTVKGAVAREQDLPIAGYDGLNVDEVTSRLPGLSQVDLAAVEAYERKHDDRTTVTERIASLRGDEPWSGYDEQTVEDVRKRLDGASEAEAKAVRDYERAHKDRAGVIEAAERETATA